MDLTRARIALGVVLVLLLVLIGLFLGGVVPQGLALVVAGVLVAVLAVIAFLADRPRRGIVTTTDAWDRSQDDLTLLNTKIANRHVSQPPRIRRRGH